MSNNPFRQYQAPPGPPPGRNSGNKPDLPPAPTPGLDFGRNDVVDYAPPAGPPPGRSQQHNKPSGPPPGHDDYAPPSGPPPGKHSSEQEYVPPSGPPPRWDEYAPPSGPPPGRRNDSEYAPPSGPPPGRSNDYEYAPPSGPPPGRRADADYAPPPGPPPGHPTAQLEDLSLEPPTNQAWQAVPDTSLYPPPPAFNHQFSTNNASADDADRAAEWVARNSLYKPGNFPESLLQQVKVGEVRFEKPQEYTGDIVPLKGGKTQGFSRQWKIRSKANCPDTTLSPTLPIYIARTMSLQTIYYEVQLLSKPSDDSILVLGYIAPPYPPCRLPGWHRGSLAVHGDDGRRFVADPDGGRDFTEPFRKDERLGIGMAFTKSDAPPTYDAVQLAKTEVFLTRNGKKVDSWRLDEEIDADARGAVGLQGENDLFIAIGICGAVNAEVFVREEDWLYRP